MTLTQLKYFLAVCACGTASAAAEHMHVSQPSLSSSIRALEEEFGVTLFQRKHRGMKLTSEGELFLDMSRDLLSRAEEAERTMNSLGNARRTLRLGMPPMIGSLLLPRIFHEFVPQNKDIKLDITEGGRQELLSKLSEGFADMVFLPHSAPLDGELSLVHAARFELVFCISKESSLVKKEAVSLKELDGIPLVLFNDGFFQTEQIRHRFADAGVAPNVILQSDQLSTVISMISRGVCAGFMFEELIADSDDIVSLPITEPMHIDVSLAWKKSVPLKDAMRKFKRYVERI